MLIEFMLTQAAYAACVLVSALAGASVVLHVAHVALVWSSYVEAAVRSVNVGP